MRDSYIFSDELFFKVGTPNTSTKPSKEIGKMHPFSLQQSLDLLPCHLPSQNPKNLYQAHKKAGLTYRQNTNPYFWIPKIHFRQLTLKSPKEYLVY